MTASGACRRSIVSNIIVSEAPSRDMRESGCESPNILWESHRCTYRCMPLFTQLGHYYVKLRYSDTLNGIYHHQVQKTTRSVHMPTPYEPYLQARGDRYPSRRGGEEVPRSIAHVEEKLDSCATTGGKPPEHTTTKQKHRYGQNHQIQRT